MTLTVEASGSAGSPTPAPLPEFVVDHSLKRRQRLILTCPAVLGIGVRDDLAQGGDACPA